MVASFLRLGNRSCQNVLGLDKITDVFSQLKGSMYRYKSGSYSFKGTRGIRNSAKSPLSCRGEDSCKTEIVPGIPTVTYPIKERKLGGKGTR
jgi:hypothetical protein